MGSQLFTAHNVRAWHLVGLQCWIHRRWLLAALLALLRERDELLPAFGHRGFILDDLAEELLDFIAHGNRRIDGRIRSAAIGAD